MQKQTSTGTPALKNRATTPTNLIALCRSNMIKSFLLRFGIIFSFILLGALAFKTIEFKPNMSFLNVAILSGSTVGNYYSIIANLDFEAAKEDGKVVNISSKGSVENIKRLVVAQNNCSIHFALVQDGTDWHREKGLQLIGRVGSPESVLFLGRDADNITKFSDLAGKRIGIGPEGSGTALLARQILGSPSFDYLNLQLINVSIQEQMAQLVKKELALGVFVMQEDAKLLLSAINEKKLQIADFQLVEAMAHEFPYLYLGVINPGQYNPVREYPPSARKVLKLDTLLIGNSCVSHSQAIGIMTLLRKQFPDFIYRNRSAQMRHAILMSSPASFFLDNNGGGIADTHVPWLVDFMPASNWVYAVMILSLFYNIMMAWHSFRLSSIDSKRVAAERCIKDMFGRSILKDEIARFNIPGDLDFSEDRLNELIGFLETQMSQCRRQSLSVLVPMGEEIGYRDQETLMEDMLGALKILRYRLSIGKAKSTHNK